MEYAISAFLRISREYAQKRYRQVQDAPNRCCRHNRDGSCDRDPRTSPWLARVLPQRAPSTKGLSLPHSHGIPGLSTSSSTHRITTVHIPVPPSHPSQDTKSEMPPRRVRRTQGHMNLRDMAGTTGEIVGVELRRRPQGILALPTDVINEVRHTLKGTRFFY